MGRSLINRTGRKNREKSALWPDFIYFNPARTLILILMECVCRFYFNMLFKAWFWLNVCRFLPVFSFKILHVFQFSERKNPPAPRAMLVWVSFEAKLHNQLALAGLRHPHAARHQANCVPNSHRELNQPPPPPRKKRKKEKRHLKSSLKVLKKKLNCLL